jgi:hypothetical protein
MRALEEFDTTLTLCFTPEHLGIVPHYTSPPKNPQEFADFAAWAVSRYAPRMPVEEQLTVLPPPSQFGGQRVQVGAED